MPKPLKEFLKSLLTKAGVDVDKSEALTNELEAPIFTSTTVSEELERGIDNGLLSIEMAKNNHPDIKKHYFASAYNGLDSEINALMDELQLGDDVKNVVLNERSSTKRAALLTKKVKELEEKKKQTTNDTAKESLQQTINKLNQDIATEKNNAAQLKSDFDKKIKEFKRDFKLESQLGQYKTVYDDLPQEVKMSALKALVNKALQDSDADLNVDDKENFTLLRRDGANVFGDDNRQLTPQSFLDKVMSQNKVLKVTDSKGSQNQQGNNSQNGHTTVIDTGNGNNGNGQGKKVDAALVSILQGSRKDMENAGKASII